LSFQGLQRDTRGAFAFPGALARRLLSHQTHEERSEFLKPEPLTAEEAMTTSSLKPAALTSQNRLRTAAAPLRESNRRPADLTTRSRPTGAARRFLSALMNSFSAWAV
jgi:hypothetical protein